jgi:hypothetical protein
MHERRNIKLNAADRGAARAAGTVRAAGACRPIWLTWRSRTKSFRVDFAEHPLSGCAVIVAG